MLLVRSSNNNWFIAEFRDRCLRQSERPLKPLTRPTLDPQAIPQLLNYLTVTKLPLGLVLFFGATPKVRRVIRDDRRDYPIPSR